MLSASISKYFTGGIRNRGQGYFKSGQVRILSTGSSSVVAEVHGSEIYTVTLGITHQAGADKKIEAFCTCPYVDSNLDFCKHIWATILAVEKSAPFASLTGHVVLELLGESSDDEYDDDDMDDADPGSIRTGSRQMQSHILRNLAMMATPAGLRKLMSGERSISTGRKSPRKPKAPPLPAWSSLFQTLAAKARLYVPPDDPVADSSLQPIYVLETQPNTRHGGFAIGLAQQLLTASGKPGKPKRLPIRAADINRMTDPIDRQICLMLVGAGSTDPSYGYYGSSYGSYQPAQSHWRIVDEVRSSLLPLLFQTGRFRFRHPQTDELVPLAWDEEPWELFLPIQNGSKGGVYSLSIGLRRGDHRLDILSADWIVDGEPMLFVHNGLLSQARAHGCAQLVDTFRMQSSVPIEKSDRDKLFAGLSQIDRLPPVEWPDDWNIVEVRDTRPKPELHLTLEKEALTSNRSYARGDVKFRYNDLTVQPGRGGTVIYDPKELRQIHRCRDDEQRLLGRLRELGAEPDPYGGHLRFLERKIPAMLGPLLDEGWTVLGNRKLFRSSGQFAINVITGIDWFELDGKIDFGGQSASLPELLAAARKGERFVRLGDGSMGMLPEKWLAQHRALLELGQAEDGKVRYAKTQIGLIDAMLAQMPEATFDANLAAARERIRSFNGIAPRSAPPEFVGTLRTYQEQGLAWLSFLNDFGWGGCLADDMGLGKTIQLLALLVDRKRQKDRGPSLLVMPKSIVFNWVREAAAFAPHLRVLDYTGGARSAARDDLKKYDVVLTTYGTMRRDIEFLTKPQFNYVVLDEAQAIKNPASQNAKAVRLLKARHRVVMTGTPVENQLGDLWSLFEFLNPGMLGTAAAFRGAFSPSRNQDASQLTMLHQTLRPFILRRTKDQVAPELPQRTEQTIDCEMGPKQAAYYKELRDYYRETLLGRVEKVGLAKSKVYVLEALLRLRQAACHPGLIDESKLEMESAKIEALMPMISELVEEGHKALIFSQFTSMLAIVRTELDKKGITYEYLDGKTMKRDEKVDRFQRDAKCPLFLISLKAGGMGLNLTAADYVFLLDPWWNPAVEAQAIDRTHRIGQTKSVIAYRIITRETVEAKILELQKTKRELADAIITQANSLIQTLTREDLALLLS